MAPLECGLSDLLEELLRLIAHSVVLEGTLDAVPEEGGRMADGIWRASSEGSIQAPICQLLGGTEGPLSRRMQSRVPGGLKVRVGCTPVL